MIFNAYNDKKNIILIEYEGKETLFYINDDLLDIKLIRKEKNIFYYQANYEIDFSKEYIIRDEHNNFIFLTYRYIVKTDYFDNKFYYNENDLGPTYCKDFTSFKIWAPISSEAYVCYFVDNTKYEKRMERGNNGVFEVTINQDLKDVLYHYVLKTNGKYIVANDPYSYSGNANFKQSAVIDLNEINIPMYNEYLSKLNSSLDAIIYELNIRDFTGEDFYKDNKMTYTALCMERLYDTKQHPLGLEYLKYLGISHIQLMPVLDYVTVDELHKEDSYNWGYDPAAFNILEGSYSKNPDNPKQRIIDFKKMVAQLHKNNLRVVLDVVFNHMYSTENNIFNQIIPNYFFLIDENGNYSNGSFCGNDIDTTRKMVKKYFLDMVKRYISIYHIDGLRLDLMGILDYHFINELVNETKKLKDDFIIYGEGWNMPSMLKESERASIYNYKKCPNVAFFNDYFRDKIKGKSSDYELSEKGYINGNSYLIDAASIAMSGSVSKYSYFDDAKYSINYIECHDNITLYDKLKISNPELTDFERNLLQMNIIACIIFSLGIPFLHSGMEINRSKNGYTNTYNSGDSLNHFPWENLKKHFDNVIALKDFIEIRKKYKVFKLHTQEEIKKHFSYEKIGNDILKITYKNLKELDNISELVMIFNNTNDDVQYKFDSQYQLICTNRGKTNQKFTYYIIPNLSFSLFIK